MSSRLLIVLKGEENSILTTMLNGYCSVPNFKTNIPVMAFSKEVKSNEKVECLLISPH